jgi:hypothetical protein
MSPDQRVEFIEAVTNALVTGFSLDELRDLGGL